ncbi:hypothetical protein [Phenylobacterium sp.]|uniref:hypothetical protein n=1 Tax=Phenylobacterium sp. TaxID=1871053 RepID=UPI002810A345|nr:hypothetical protein [Phenylobacterium sp.]
MRVLSTFLALLLGACASGTDPVPLQPTRYPNDLADAYADPPERFADPGDLVWLSALQAPRGRLDGFTLTARNPATGETVTRRIDGWQEAEAGGGVRYFAPDSYFYAGLYSPVTLNGRLAIIRNDTPAPDLPPPYVCVRNDRYSQANLTWKLGHCRPGKPQGSVRYSYGTDLRDWNEHSIRFVGVEDGAAIFLHRQRAGRKPGEAAPTLAPFARDARFSARAGERASIPEGLSADIDIQVTRIEGSRVFYRLARRIIPCRHPSGCIEE